MTADWQIHSFETLTSTQDIARQYLTEGKLLPFAVQADMQTASRGRSGNKWVSVKGNLLTSLVIPLQNVRARDAGQYSFLTSVALIQTLKDLGVEETIQNKWPNDVLVNGQKIAGILLESDIGANGTLQALIIGIGVNLVSAPEGAAHIGSYIQNVPQPTEVLHQFIDHLQAQLDIIAREGFAPIRKTWLSLAYGLGSEIRVRLPHETFYGIFNGLDENGALIVQVKDGDAPRIIHSGEVFFAPTEES